MTTYRLRSQSPQTYAILRKMIFVGSDTYTHKGMDTCYGKWGRYIVSSIKGEKKPY